MPRLFLLPNEGVMLRPCTLAWYWSFLLVPPPPPLSCFPVGSATVSPSHCHVLSRTSPPPPPGGTTATQPGRDLLPLHFYFRFRAGLCFCVWSRGRLHRTARVLPGVLLPLCGPHRALALRELRVPMSGIVAVQGHDMEVAPGLGIQRRFSGLF